MANYDSTNTGANIDSAVNQIIDSSTDLNIDSNSLVVDKSENNVGIGVTAPGGIANSLSLVPDLEIRGAAGTGAACAGVLALTTAETSTVDGDVQGAIVFQSPIDGSGTDAILSGAAIWAEADATFSSSVNNTEFVFATNTTAAATERMRIEADGTIAIKTGNIRMDGSAGQGVDFSGSQAAAAAGSMGSEVLDAYEEGTWTPVLSDGSNNAGVDTAAGTYTKIGNLVTLRWIYTTNDVSGLSSGAVRFTGLPFTSNATSGNYGIFTAGFGGGLAVGAGENVGGYINPNTAHILLQLWDATTGTTVLTDSDFSSDGSVLMFGQYHT